MPLLDAKPCTIQNLLRSLGEQGLIDDADDFKNAIKNIRNLNNEADLQFYTKFLVGLGTFISGICLLAFLFFADIINFANELQVIGYGILFIALALYLHHIARQINPLQNINKQTFILQGSLILMLAGKILFVLGWATYNSEDISIPVAMITVTVLTLPFYRIRAEQFISITLCILALTHYAGLSRDLEYYRPLAQNSLFALQWLIVLITLLNKRANSNAITIGYASLLSICINILLAYYGNNPALPFMISAYEHYAVAPFFINLTMVATLLLIIAWLGEFNQHKLTHPPILLGMFATLILGLVNAADIAVIITILLIGFKRLDYKLLIGGSALLPIWLVLFYYSHDFSLLEKAGVLSLSGAVLLLGYAYIHIRKRDQLRGIG